MADTKICPKCSAEMKRGDFTYALPGYASPLIPGPKVMVNKAIPVGVFVCPDCQFVELYLDRT
jgi:hypothetical protein